ncbi:MAG: hypothetical protein MAG451_02134 [Anaerolineales bacterium]|nr:hypothetical protein [Anaerolineales bacterium]
MTTQREDRLSRITERLRELDDETLERFDALLSDGFGVAPADAEEDEPRLLTRRQLLAGLVAGGAALGGANVATAWYAREQGVAVGWQMGANAGEARMMAEASKTQQEMQAEIDALRGLVAHYEALDTTDLDRAVAQSIERYESSVAGLPATTQPLADGVDAVREGLERFEATVPAIRQGIAQVDDTLDALDERLDGLREVLAETVERAEPVAERLQRFFDAVLDRLPFGIGDQVELVLLRLRQVVDGVPATMTAVRDDLLAPLRSTWFDDTDAQDVQAGLLTPVRAQVLDPAEQLLSELSDADTVWQRDVAEPVREVLAERESRRQALAAYRKRHEL